MRSYEKGVMEKEEQKNKKKYVIIAVVNILVVALLGAYMGMAAYFSSHFYPGTVINGIACGNADAIAVSVQMLMQAKEYRLEVVGRNPRSDSQTETLLTIKAEDIDFTPLNTKEKATEILKQQNAWLWIVHIFGKNHSRNIVTEMSYDMEKLDALLEECPAFQKKNMKKPEDAYIAGYSEEEKQFVLVPETLGTTLDEEAAKDAIVTALTEKRETVDLEEQDCYKTARVTAEDTQLQKNLKQANLWLDTCITYDWNGTEVVLDKEQLKDWITIEKNKPVLSEELVAEFVKENARAYDTYGKNRKFLTTLGTELTLPSGGFGWKTDREGEAKELVQLIYQGSVMEKEPIYSVRGAQKGSNDIGNSYVEADLSNQHLYLYQEGQLVLETDFVSGNMSNGCMTPPGVFGLTYKTQNAVLRGEDYETPVNYWMPFNGNVGMHDATWRYEFGGDIYLTRGSHGCINLPLSMAEQIYGYVSTGFPVICYYY